LVLLYPCQTGIESQVSVLCLCHSTWTLLTLWFKNKILTLATFLRLVLSLSSGKTQNGPRFVGLIMSRNRYTNPYQSNVELDSTALSVLPDPMSRSSRQVNLHCFILVYPNFLLPSGCFWTLKLEIFWKINLDQTVGIDKNKLYSKGLRQDGSQVRQVPPVLTDRSSSLHGLSGNACSDLRDSLHLSLGSPWLHCQVSIIILLNDEILPVSYHLF
jgi:hypothetical protein